MTASGPTITICPKCGYKRTPRDQAPAWQCPKCQVAYNKVMPGTDVGSRPVQEAPAPQSLRVSPRYRFFQRNLTVLLVLAVIATGLAWQRKKSLPALDYVDPTLLREPEQSATQRAGFSFQHSGTLYEVAPVASYDLRGLVVTHNDIDAFWDIYHDESSVDTRDICVVWGDNLTSDDIHSVKFWSTAWTCHFEYPYGKKINAHQVSNNHLITDNPQIRKSIGKLRVGDQVRMRGLLVNYREAGSEFWRETSTDRTDSGANACEVVFVEQLDILKSGNAQWYTLFNMARRSILALIVAKLLLLFWSLMRPISGHRQHRRGVYPRSGS